MCIMVVGRVDRGVGMDLWNISLYPLEPIECILTAVRACVFPLSLHFTILVSTVDMRVDIPSSAWGWARDEYRGIVDIIVYWEGRGRGGDTGRVWIGIEGVEGRR